MLLEFIFNWLSFFNWLSLLSLTVNFIQQLFENRLLCGWPCIESKDIMSLLSNTHRIRERWHLPPQSSNNKANTEKVLLWMSTYWPAFIVSKPSEFGTMSRAPVNSTELKVREAKALLPFIQLVGREGEHEPRLPSSRDHILNHITWSLRANPPSEDLQLVHGMNKAAWD